jgi:hypothetical protein
MSCPKGDWGNNMPDLTIEIAWTCKTNVYWETNVMGSQLYYVTWRQGPRPEADAMYGWHCSCPAYQYGHGKYCKHIEAVIAEGKRCGWNAELDPTAQCDIANFEPFCPQCGGEVISFKVGV